MNENVAEFSTLTRLIEEDNSEAIEGLLIEGWDPNQRDHSGMSPLEMAVNRGRPRIAACLLAYGADPTPLKPERIGIEMLHKVRQHYHRFQKREWADRISGSAAVERAARDLRERGIIKLPGLLDKETLAQLQRDFRQFVLELQVKIAKGQGIFRHYDEELHLWPQDKAFVGNNAFKYSNTLVRLCCHELIVGIANRYLRREAHIQRGVAMRYLPMEGVNRDMFLWHHDIEEQRVKIQILLTDVGETDQSMSYVLGSHRLFHPYQMFFQNHCPLDYCRDHLGDLKVARAIGKAGDIFMFDSNGAHRGNRFPNAAVRDTFFVEYSADNSQVWGGDIDTEALAGVDPQHARVFDRMLKADKKWNLQGQRGPTPDWILTLPDVVNWL